MPLLEIEQRLCQLIVIAWLFDQLAGKSQFCHGIRESGTGMGLFEDESAIIYGVSRWVKKLCHFELFFAFKQYYYNKLAWI